MIVLKRGERYDGNKLRLVGWIERLGIGETTTCRLSSHFDGEGRYIGCDGHAREPLFEENGPTAERQKGRTWE